MTVEHNGVEAMLRIPVSILGASPLPTEVLDCAGLVRVWNPAAERLLGWTAEEVIGNLPPGIPEGEQETFARQFEQALRGEAITGVERRRRTMTGALLDVRVAAAPLLDATGQIMGVVRTFEDISERKRAEEAQQLLATLADASALLASSLDYEITLKSFAEVVVPRIADWCAIHLVDERGAVRQITVMHSDPARVQQARELERRYPFDPDAPYGVPRVLRTGEPEITSEITDEMLASSITDAELLQVLGELGLKSSMIVPLAARGHTLGAITFVAAESGRRYGPDDVALVDVLARRAALAVDNARLYREAQQVAAERSAILSQMTDGVIMCDTSGTVTFMNGAAQALYGADFTGLSLANYRGNPSLRDDHGEPYRAEALPMQRALDGQVVLGEEAELERADGSTIVIQRSVTPVNAPDGTRLGAVMTVRDVTARRTLEQQKEDFLSAAAHDLKSPLTSIKGMAQLLLRRVAREGGSSMEQIGEGLARIEQNASRMTSLINELLDLSRLQMGEPLQLNSQPTDLVSLVARLVAEQQLNAGSERVTMQSRVPELVGSWDADRLERVMANLFSNALKYSPSGAPIAVTLWKEERGGRAWAVVSVQDGGIGIPREDLPHIFERFHRGRNVGRETLGTGIGLAGARQIVEQHGGTIEVRSEEGVGSTFTVRLPVT